MSNVVIHTATGQTSLPSDLVQAYLETDYRVTELPNPFVLRVGRLSPDLTAIFKHQPCKSAAFLTAWNPYSQALSPEDNRTRAQKLRNEICSRGLIAFGGVGKHPSGDWPGEESLLILNVSWSDCVDLGCRFEQNAVVWVGQGAVPTLILLR